MTLLKIRHAADRVAFGTWRTIGYNKCFELSPDRFSIHDLSAVSCVLSKEGHLSDFIRVFDRIEYTLDGRLHFYARGGITRYSLLPFSLKTEIRGPSSPGDPDPEYNFEVFWHYFKENYAFFELRAVDWEKTYRHYRPLVSARTGNQELASLLTQILREINDSHATLDIPGQTITTRRVHALVRQWQSEFKTDQFLELYPRGIPRLFAALNAGVLDGRGRSALNGQLLWGRIEPRIGYLCVFSMMDMYADFDLLHYAGFEVTNQPYLQALGEAVDQAITELADAEALILDVRFNPGGHDAAGGVIASRFVDKKRLAFTKQARNEDGLTQPQKIYLVPKGATQFTRPVFVLTSEATASAAETFVYFMMALPHVTRMGGKTRGVLSDTLLMRLPNGWVTSISNEVYTTAAGSCYEGSGIPPQVEAPVFNPDNFYQDLSLTVQKAVTLIK